MWSAFIMLNVSAIVDQSLKASYNNLPRSVIRLFYSPFSKKGYL